MYYPYEVTTLPDVLELCTQEKMDFSIHVKKSPPVVDNIGGMIIWPTLAYDPPYTVCPYVDFSDPTTCPVIGD